MKRGSVTQIPRHIKIETAHIGDTIKIEWVAGELIKTIIGCIASRDYDGSWTNLYAKDGQVIWRYNTQLTTKYKVTLLHSAPSRDQPSLFDIPGWMA